MLKSKFQLLLTALVLIITVQSHGQELTKAHQDSLENLVDQYYQLNLKIFKSGSTVEDIDKVFDLFADDFVYVHPKYGGEYPRENLYVGYVRNQKNGAYNGSITDVNVRNMISGLNAVATERAYLQKDEEGQIKEVDPGMTLFEFRDGKISRIVEYW